jgi:tetraacyldisaccharide 4'-kinase
MSLRSLLWPLDLLYAAAICVRNGYYDRRRTAVHRAAVPVISVGNLTVGGTGKTPLVVELVRRLRAWGHRPAIVTRGYKGRPGQPADEVLEYRAAVPEVPVVVNVDRVAGAAQACADGADSVVLDDGFQHRRLARDLDVVLIDALDPWGGGWLLPAGRLREPLSSLGRADVLVITRANQVPPTTLGEITHRLRRWAARQPVVLAHVEPAGLSDRTGQPLELQELHRRPVLGVCGLGNPRTFQYLLALHADRPDVLVFADHARYGRRAIRRIVERARRGRAEWVVTTRKDWVKLASVWPSEAPPLIRLDARLVLGEGVEELDRRLRQVMETRR